MRQVEFEAVVLLLGADLDANDRACSAHTLTLPAAAPAPK
jgi:hypothetical protein